MIVVMNLKVRDRRRWRDDEQRDGSVAEQEVHSEQDLERVNKALRKLHTSLGHLGVSVL